MNEESREMPQPAEAAPEQSPEVAQPTEAKTENTTSNETPDKSVTETRRSIWDKLLGRKAKVAAVTAATGAAVAAGMAMAPSASAETQEKPTTSISQAAETKTEDGITVENDDVIKVDRDQTDFNLTKIDDKKILVEGESGDMTNSANMNKGLEDLSGVGIHIEGIKPVDTVPGNEGAYTHIVEATVDDADKLNRFKDISDKTIEENGHIVRVNEKQYDIGKVNDDTVLVKGEGKGPSGVWSSNMESSGQGMEKGLKDMAKAGIQFEQKDVKTVGIPGNEGEYTNVVEVNVDDTNALDKMAEEEK